MLNCLGHSLRSAPEWASTGSAKRLGKGARWLDIP